MNKNTNNKNSWLNWISIIVGIAGLAWGFYQDSYRRKLEEEQRSDAWAMMNICKKSYGQFEDYRRSNPSLKSSSDAEQSYARLQELYYQSIKHLFKQYDKVDTILIQSWVKEGRIPPTVYKDFTNQIYY